MTTTAATSTPAMHVIRRVDGESIGEHAFFACDGPADWTVADEDTHDDPATFEILACFPVARRTFGAPTEPEPDGERLFDIADIPVDPLLLLTVEELRERLRASDRQVAEASIAAMETEGRHHDLADELRALRSVVAKLFEHGADIVTKPDGGAELRMKDVDLWVPLDGKERVAVMGALEPQEVRS
jgi:hypothetical protein